jgi:hypothetical protein
LPPSRIDLKAIHVPLYKYVYLYHLIIYENAFPMVWVIKMIQKVIHLDVRLDLVDPCFAWPGMAVGQTHPAWPNTEEW